ncbi:hypothetical protein PCASD_13500 [Puccinia coronata f. sp. avenae]|uniref:Uncharacterized protein n=1 Tax=Puccinia coronata f. sp. avenae TaxID=200324 RepID=A0A2N5TEE7_9BASI|nr:hypothetical protein PCASD_13500 [Puccinia coronata f. sp. avenae]
MRPNPSYRPNQLPQPELTQPTSLTRQPISLQDVRLIKSLTGWGSAPMGNNRRDPNPRQTQRLGSNRQFTLNLLPRNNISNTPSPCPLPPNHQLRR